MNDSRTRRYAEAMGTPLPQPTGRPIRRIEAVMALVDAEINQVQDEAEGWAKSSSEAFSAWHEALARAEKAEARLARVEALCDGAGSIWGVPMVDVHLIRAALAEVDQ